jgi:hypothetical protein
MAFRFRFLSVHFEFSRELTALLFPLSAASGAQACPGNKTKCNGAQPSGAKRRCVLLCCGPAATDKGHGGETRFVALLPAPPMTQAELAEPQQKLAAERGALDKEKAQLAAALEILGKDKAQLTADREKLGKKRRPLKQPRATRSMLLHGLLLLLLLLLRRWRLLCATTRATLPSRQKPTLRSLTNVGGYLAIVSNTNLASVEGLRSLKSIRDTNNGYVINLDSNPVLARGLPFPELTCNAGPVWPCGNNAYVTANIAALNRVPKC